MHFILMKINVILFLFNKSTFFCFLFLFLYPSCNICVQLIRGKHHALVYSNIYLLVKYLKVLLAFFLLIYYPILTGLQEKHQLELENLTLTAAPFKMLKFFTLAVVQYLKRLITYLLTKGGWLLFLSVLILAFGVLLITIDGPHEKGIDFMKGKTRRPKELLPNLMSHAHLKLFVKMGFVERRYDLY